MKKSLIVALSLVLFGMAMTASAQESLPRDNGVHDYFQGPDWRESESHPLRIAAYILHPIGWVFREGIFRPWSAFTSSNDFNRSFWGYRDPYSHREPECFSSSDESPNCRELPPVSGTRYGALAGQEPAPVVVTPEVVFPDIAFEYDKSTLNALGRGRVRQVAQMLSSAPSVAVAIEGHTDVRGSDKYNEALGMRRADTVKKELTELGVDPARMTAVSKGETQPVFTEDTDWAHATNRRVHFAVNN